MNGGSPRTLRQRWSAVSLPNKLSLFLAAFTFVLTSLNAALTSCSSRTAKRLLNQAQRSATAAERSAQSAFDLSKRLQRPYVDVVRAELIASPRKTAEPLVALTLENKGDTPAKNVRLVSHLQLKPPNTRRCPPLQFPSFGPTYPSNSPQTVLKSADQKLSGEEVRNYSIGQARLFLWGRVIYADFRQDADKDPPRSSIFCRSIGVENETLTEKAKMERAVMVPCTDQEWPFDDLHAGPEEHPPFEAYRKCSPE
jgi:hypothetical protein